MIVIIDNNLIETQYIYAITPIIISDTGREYSFTIKFLNQKDLTIIKNTSDEFPMDKFKQYLEEYKGSFQDLKNHIKIQVERMHTEIVKVWNETERVIPTINYEKINYYKTK